MIYRNNVGVLVQTGIETPIIEWISDGITRIMGFTGTGSCSAEYSLYVEDDNDSGQFGEGAYYSYQTSPTVRTAYIADRAFLVSEGKKVTLKVYHDSGQAELFKATLLG